MWRGREQKILTKIKSKTINMETTSLITMKNFMSALLTVCKSKSYGEIHPSFIFHATSVLGTRTVDRSASVMVE